MHCDISPERFPVRPRPARDAAGHGRIVPLAGGGRLRDGILYLDPRLFARLDGLARSEAGLPICVYDHTEAPGVFAYSTAMRGSVVLLHESGRMIARAMDMIHLANQVDLAAFRASERPEMDWSAIPVEMVYPFLVRHEIAHMRHRDPGRSLRAALSPRDPALGRRCALAAEARADCEAWAALCPGHPLPVRHKSVSPDLPEWPAALDGADIHRRNRAAPAALDLDRVMPHAHVREGIPWSFPRLTGEKLPPLGLSRAVKGEDASGGRGE